MEPIKSQKYNEVQWPAHKQGIEAYSHWFSQQPLETQREYIRLGLGPEAREGDGNYTFEVKPDHKAYAYTEEMMADDGIDPTPQRTYTDDEVQEVIRRVVMAMQLSESPDCLFQARCILIAFGIGDPPSETELAKQRDCSRQFVSKKVKRIQELFNLSPSQYMRSEAACKAYADAWQRNQIKRSQQPRRASKTIQPDNNIELNLTQATRPRQSRKTHTPQPATQKKSYRLPHTPPPPSPPSKESISNRTTGAGS
jgi:hypothetical protein